MTTSHRTIEGAGIFTNKINQIYAFIDEQLDDGGKKKKKRKRIEIQGDMLLDILTFNEVRNSVLAGYLCCGYTVAFIHSAGNRLWMEFIPDDNQEKLVLQTWQRTTTKR